MNIFSSKIMDIESRYVPINPFPKISLVFIMVINAVGSSDFIY